MRLLSTLRRTFVLLIVAAVAAGCATPDESSGPTDLNQDADRDGIPDGNSPVPGTNETNDTIEGPPTNGTLDESSNSTFEPTLNNTI